MTLPFIRILLVEDNPGDARLFKEFLKNSRLFLPELHKEECLADALNSLKETVVDVLIVDLSLPDSSGLDTFRRIHEQAPEIPILLLSGSRDEELAITAMAHGAQDYLLKNEMDPLRLQRSILYAVERVRLTRSLRDSEQKQRKIATQFHNTLESITDAFVTLDHDWRFSYVNPEAERQLGRSREHLIGQNFWEEFPPGPDAKYAPAYRKAMAEQVVVSFVDFYPPLKKWFEAKAYPSEDGLSVFFQDITRRKAVEERLREQAELLDKARDAILVLDLDNRIQFWNDSAEKLYGWTEEEAVGQNCKNLLYRKPDEFDTATSRTLETGEWVGELDQTTKSGETVIVEGHWNLVRNDQGHPKSILSINTDITKRKSLEQQFLRAQRMESIGTLAGGIAHDLNNVFAPIMMAIDLLKLYIHEEEGLEILDTVSRSSQRGAEMVKQVLSFARGMDGQRVNLQIKHLLREIEHIARDTFPKNIHLSINLDDDLWAVEGDPTQLHQVLVNLCVNARDAMEDGGEIRISADNIRLDEQYAAMNIEARTGPHVRIEVEDNGIGIPADILNKIFDPFFTTKDIGKGTGLGLSTSLAIIKSHGGFIRAYSDPGVGTSFRIYLPAQPTAEGEILPENKSELPRGRGETVLIVDDEAAIRDITRQTLEAFGYRVMDAADGAEAVSIYLEKQNEIDVVLTDMMMPVMDGPSTINILRRYNPKVRIIGASGIAGNGQIARAEDAGVSHFLPKPYTAENLLKAMRKILE